jgi:hypothetical protein
VRNLKKGKYTYGNHLDTLGGKFLCGLLGYIASNSTEFVLFAENGVSEDGLDYRATLVACGTEYCDEF